ncbi:unnamed protein product (macronuclear) [Paramecium tetraurelia]|uniref:Uncharacterized protein n=1 Tax=Paramecium tetraurelia TaxID=5888 RepID=A0D6A1_PARTE|nr:uncharacterized protein GSPATT00039300001 [Paramecium tetraurelia]CAK78568.1 unnamed protein product [Paramecium tetraurelia]|eukprot:XP_001445965.1 hypothetical protein (macronuclear) [Paramecium tetraurelia strain d4-2]
MQSPISSPIPFPISLPTPTPIGDRQICRPYYRRPRETVIFLYASFDQTQDFFMYLTIDMSSQQITKVLTIKENYFDSYFSEIQDDFEYKGLLRKCVLINSKGGVYAFCHKSIQEYFVVKYFLNLIKKIFITDKVDENALRKSKHYSQDITNYQTENKKRLKK